MDDETIDALEKLQRLAVAGAGCAAILSAIIAQGGRLLREQDAMAAAELERFKAAFAHWTGKSIETFGSDKAPR